MPSPPRRVNASSSSRVFSDEPEPSSISVLAPVSAGDVGGVLGQHRPLGPGRVVLRQPGDLLEQLAAPGVVEPLRRQPLRRRRSTRPGRPGPQRTVQVLLLQVDLQRLRAHRPCPLCSGRHVACPTGRPRSAADAPAPRSRWRRPGARPAPAASPGRRRAARRPAAPSRPPRAPTARARRRWPPPSRPSVSSRFSRDPGAAAATSAHRAGDRLGRSSRRRAAGAAPAPTAAPSRSARPGSAGRAPAARRRAATTASGQPRTTPLWLNSHRPSANGAAALVVHRHARPWPSAPRPAPRRPGSPPPDPAASGRSRSAGPAGSAPDRPSPGYQPTPKPSALIVPPPRMSRGAQDCRTSECGGSNSSSASVTGGPR